MTDRNPPAIEDVFRTLDRWRHLPAYRLEPNLAPFFGLFLPDILHWKFGPGNCAVVPEFPLHKGTLKKGENNQSVKIDYAIFQKDRSKAYFIELKTDRDSFKPEQRCNLIWAKKAGLHCLVHGVEKISDATNREEKYKHLRHLIEKIIGPENISSLRGWTVNILYITPDGSVVEKSKTKKCNKKECFDGACAMKELSQDYCLHEISFNCVADIVENRGHLGLLFANYLRKWTKQAGKEDPQKVWRTE